MQKAIVVGASSGIGRALSQKLVMQGYQVGITGRRKEQLRTLEAENPKHYCVSSFDCRTADNAAALDKLTQQLGGLDLLIFCSGTANDLKTLDFAAEKPVLDLNISAFTEVLVWAYNYFDKQGRGQIAAISSVAGIVGNGLYPSYYASKAYQINYLQGLQQRAFKSGKEIYICDIRPGFVDTAMARGEGLFWVSPVEKAAAQIYRAITLKMDRVYISKRWRLISVLLSLLPASVVKRLL